MFWSFSAHLKVYFPVLDRMENYRKNDHEIDDGQKEDLELPHFELTAVANAINNFSINNNLGEGGYGPVYGVNIINI